MSTRPNRIAATAAIVISLLVGFALPASADPPYEVFEGNDATWACFGDEGAQVPPHHCLNIRGNGRTGIILVFPPDDRGPAEGVAGPEADLRPCPHDPGSPDGTWWEPVPGLFVCHHRP